MVKSVLSTSNKGLVDWLIQRVSAVVMAVYILGLAGFIISHPDMAYYEWHGLFSQLWVKVVSLLFVVCLLAHAWVGIWTVFTDYIKIHWLRLVLHSLVFIVLVAFFFQALLILWSV